MGGGLPAAVDGRSRRAEEAGVNMGAIVQPSKRKGRPEGRPFALLLTSGTLRPKVGSYHLLLTQPPLLDVVQLRLTSPVTVFSTVYVSFVAGASVVSL